MFSFVENNVPLLFGERYLYRSIVFMDLTRPRFNCRTCLHLPAVYYVLNDDRFLCGREREKKANADDTILDVSLSKQTIHSRFAKLLKLG